MEIYCRGTAKILNAETRKIHEIDSDELDFEAVDSEDLEMGLETHYEASIEHPELGFLTWSLWEYPEGSVSHRDANVGRHRLVKDFEYGLEPEMPEPDDWLNFEAPVNPYSIFKNSHEQTTALLTDHGREDGDFLLNRMVFSHQITALEAYLGDTLINEVMRDADALRRLIAEAKELVEAKYSLHQIANFPDLVQTTVRAYLRDILYHNLEKVDVLYKIALGVKLLSLAKDKPRLFKAINLRHDCVHRNGFEKDGNELKVFTKPFVHTTADLIRDFVDSVEEAVRNR